MPFCNFNDFYLIGFVNLIILYIWGFFFLCNSFFLKKNFFSYKITNINVIKQKYSGMTLLFFKNIFLLKICLIFFVHGKHSLLLNNHLYINNFNMNYIYLFYIFSFFLIIFKISLYQSKINLNKDYIFSIINLIILLPFLLLVNSMFTFIFFFEIISCLLFYNLLSSRIWYNKLLNKDKNLKTPSTFINMLFFQYWVTFFSTIFIIFSYINIFYYVNSTDWFLINYFFIFKNNFVIKQTSFIASLILFTFSFIVKFGIAPLHLFKLEVYKGLPFVSIFFYTTYYFSIFFVFLIFLFKFTLPAFTVYIYYIFFFVLLFSASFVIILLFDVNFLKTFFAYSTVINSINFILIILLNFS